MLRFVSGLCLVGILFSAWAENAPRSAELQTIIETLQLEKEKTLDDEALVSQLNREIVVLYQKGQYQPALFIAQLNQQHAATSLGEEHPDTLTSINNLAFLYQAQGRYAEAEPLYQRAWQASERVLGLEHPYTLSIRLNLVANLLSLNKAAQCLEQLQHYESGLFQLAGRELRQEQDVRDKRQLLRKQSTFQNLVFSLALQHPTAQTCRFAAMVLLRWQQVEGEEQLLLQRLLRQSADPEIQQLAQRLARQRQMVSAAAHRKPFNRTESDQLEQQLQALEQSLASKSPQFRQRLAIGQVDISDLEAALEDETGLLVLRVFNPYNSKTGKLDALHWLAAWMARDTSGKVRVRLYDLGAVEDSLALWLATQRAPQASQDLYQHLFARLDPLLAGVEQLYIVSDHFLHRADFGSWRLPNGDYWLQRQSVRRLHTARDLLRRNDYPQTRGFIAFGGIAYGESIAEPPEMDQPQPVLYEASLAQRRLEEGFAFLPASLEEVEHFARDFCTCSRIRNNNALFFNMLSDF